MTPIAEVLEAVAGIVPLSGGSMHGSIVASHTRISDDTYRLALHVDRSWDFGADDGASGHARVRIRAFADGFEAFEVVAF